MLYANRAAPHEGFAHYFVDAQLSVGYFAILAHRIAPAHLLLRIAEALGCRNLRRRKEKLYSAKLNAGLSRSTTKFMHAVLHKALEQAVRWGLVARNVLDLVDAPVVKRKAPAVWGVDQARKFLEHVESHRFHSMKRLRKQAFLESDSTTCATPRPHSFSCKARIRRRCRSFWVIRRLRSRWTPIATFCRRCTMSWPNRWMRSSPSEGISEGITIRFRGRSREIGPRSLEKPSKTDAMDGVD